MDNETRSGLSALVLNWHDTLRTLRCVASLLASPLFETVLVVDNDATAESDLKYQLDLLADTRVRLISHPENRGFAGGINSGLEYLMDSAMEFFLVINNDATIAPEGVERLFFAARNSVPNTLIGPRIIYPDSTPQASGSLINWRTASVNHTAWPEPPDYLTWACVLVSRTTLETVGYLDESFFMYWEDADYSLRVKESGGHLLLLPDAIAIHDESATKETIGNLTIRYATAAMGTFATKYPRLLGAARYRLIMRAARQTFRHGMHEGLKTISAWRWGRGIREVSAWRALSQARWTR